MFVLKIDDLNSWVLVCFMYYVGQYCQYGRLSFWHGHCIYYLFVFPFPALFVEERGECSGSQYSEKGLLFTPTRPYPINIYQLSIKYSQPHGILNVASYSLCCYTIDASLIQIIHTPLPRAAAIINICCLE